MKTLMLHASNLAKTYVVLFEGRSRRWMHRFGFILGLLLGVVFTNYSVGDSLDELFPTVLQRVFPFKDYGIQEPQEISQLPDGRMFVLSMSGEMFVFDDEHWILLNKRLPVGAGKSFVDSRGNHWIGGIGFFGKLDANLEFEDIAQTYFLGDIDSSLSIKWIYETGDWIHFANNKAVYHFDTAKKRTVVTRFEGMFDAYHWMWNDMLFLGEKDQVSIWNDGSFEKKLDWPYEFKAFQGWEFEGNQYFLNSSNLYVYRGSELVEIIKDPKMKLRGVVPLPCEDYLLLFTSAGLLRMNRDGSCEGIFSPWYHQKITRFNSFEPYYSGNGDFWFLSNSAIFQANIETGVKYLGVETGYPISGVWDIESFSDDIYIAGGQGFLRWNPTSGEFELPHDMAPDFETISLWKFGTGLVLGTWVELGSYSENYDIRHSDGLYEVFACSDRSDCFWVSMDSDIRLVDKSFAIVDEIKTQSATTSFVHYRDSLWTVTQENRLIVYSLDPKGQTEDYTSQVSAFLSETSSRILVFELDERLFVLTQEVLLEFREGTFERIPIELQRDWKWVVPAYSSQTKSVVLMQKHESLPGCKMGTFSLVEGGYKWDSINVALDIGNSRVRRLKLLDGFENEVVSVITQSAVLLVDLGKYESATHTPSAPKVYKNPRSLGAKEAGVFEGVFRGSNSEPLQIQLHCGSETLEYPLRYYGRIASDQDWIVSSTGLFEFYGLLRGKRTFEGFVEDPFGNASPKITHDIRIIPPWFLSNWALGIYVLGFLVVILLVVKQQTARLRRRAAELEKIVDARTEDLLQANKAKSIFVSNVSHEIRNPLNGLLGLAQHLKEGDRIDHDILQRLRRPSLYLYRFLSNVLDFSKFETGGIRLNNRVFDGNDLIDSVEIMFAGDFEERSITFVADYRYDDSPFLLTSQEALEMILLNLIGNAVKFTPPRGSIRLALLKHEGRLSVAVSDTGVGISELDTQQIFEAYNQGSNTPLVAGEKGAGIGLSLVRHTLDQMGGTIAVSSQIGKGSTFSLSLPLGQASDNQAPKKAEDVKLEAHVLIVEDLEYNLKLFADLLKGWGASVESATTGRQALDAALGQRFDLIFLDYDLPDTTGTEIARALRKKSPNEKTAIVGLSAYTDQEYIAKGLSSGMDDYLFKPLNPSKLVHCIEKYLPEKINYQEATTAGVNETRSSLSRLQRDSNDSAVNAKIAVEQYLDTLNQLVESLKTTDLGSQSFDSIVHQLKGHCAFINHRPSVVYFHKLLQLSQSGDRMGLLESLDALDAITSSTIQEVYGLLDLDNDYAKLS